MFERGSISRKIAQCGTALGVLLAVWRYRSFEEAVLVGLAMNSADLNEARELIADD